MKLSTHWVIVCYVSAFAVFLAVFAIVSAIVSLCTGALQLH